MKAVITIFFALFIAVAAQAQDTKANVKVEGIQMEMVTLDNIRITTVKKEGEVARLYRRSGSRVKKELNFTTRKDYQMA